LKRRYGIEQYFWLSKKKEKVNTLPLGDFHPAADKGFSGVRPG
jgi:hypothetical protein